MDERTPYEILGVPEDAGDKEIKKAFREISKKYHPDRQNGKSDEEKRIAEEKFKEASSAYDRIETAEKRRDYAQQREMEKGWPYGFGPFSGMGRQRNPGYRPVRPGGSVRMQVPLSMEEIINGADKTLKFRRNVRCKTCHGVGGSNQTTCPVCHGTGFSTITQRRGNMIFQQSGPCERCNGEGMVVSDVCPTCNGAKFKTEDETINVKFPKGVDDGRVFLYQGKGSESPDKTGPNGDFVVIASHNYDKARYEVRGKDILEVKNIPWYDALLGSRIDMVLATGKTRKVQLEECTESGEAIKLIGDGIDGGNYYIFPRVEYPKKLNNVDRKHLEFIKVEHEKTS